MTAEQLKPVFEKKYDRSAWQHILRENFNVSTLLDKPADITSRIRSNPYDAKAWELGNFSTTDGHLVGIYEVAVADNVQIHRNRKGLRNLLAQVYSTDVEAALLVFIQGNKWRFSYVSEITVKNKETGKREKKSTDPKRFTYLLGEGERAKTAADRFARIKKSEDLFGKGVNLTSLEEAFNVEKMSKVFFNEYRKRYGLFTAFLTGEDENGKKICNASPFLQSKFNGDHKKARDFVKKMMGRIVFLYFLEKKGWLGVPENGFWGEGDENFLGNLFEHSIDKKGFYSNVLVPLFFASLNTERKNDYFKVEDSLFKKSGYSKLKVPYLNGGLFEEDEVYTQFLDFPEELFRNLFTFFDQYNFTVYEDSPDEHTVAVDPEMLGHIFENLLEDNKDKGAFYTPKEIVHYMCRESLIEYLYTKLTLQLSETGGYLSSGEGRGEKLRTAIEKLVLQHEAAGIIEYDEVILKALKEVKICDPAIGSGAFPMGLLMEIFHLVETLYDASPDVTEKIWELKKGWNPAQVKEKIIQNSIYGVDIEKGAVDIARLRFWLSLVVEEDTPKPLPNLDYKIVVGNSLLSKFENEVIDIDWNIKAKNASAVEKIINDQQAKLHVLQSRQHLYFVAKGDKAKLQKEIRDLKIEVLVNQLLLSKISFNEGNPKLGGFSPTQKEIQKNLENEIKLATFDKTIKQLQEIKKDNASTLNFFEWKLDFPEVMNEKVTKGEPGFDIVIGNPPYIEFKKVDAETKEQYKLFRTAKGKYDVFVLFVEVSEKILKFRGTHCFINPTTFMMKDYGRALRSFIKENFRIIEIIDFADYQIFDTAITYTGIFIFQKNTVVGYDFFFQRYKSNAKYLVTKEHLINSKQTDENKVVVQLSSDKVSAENWIFNNSFTSLMLDKLNSIPIKLKDISKYIFVGIQSGKDEVFFVDREAITKYKLEKNLLHKIYKGKDIKKYFATWSGTYIIYPYDTTTNESLSETKLRSTYPNIFEYLKENRKNLAGRGYFEKSSKHWFELWCERKLSKFKEVKITNCEISPENRFYLDEEGYLGNTKTFSTVLKEDYEKYIYLILGILNSSLMNYYHKRIASPKAGGFYDYKTQFIEKYPIVLTDKIGIQRKVQNIISIKLADPLSDTRVLEKDIDLLVYLLYQLTYEEACTVEGNTDWMSKEEYEQFKIEE